MQLCFFEDHRAQNFHPLTLTRPVDDLRIGILTIGKKWQYALESDAIGRLLRKNLSRVFASGNILSNEPCLWINARFLPDKKLVKLVKDLSIGTCLQRGDTVIAALVEGQESIYHNNKRETPDFNKLLVVECSDATSIKNYWDLFQLNGAQIEADLGLLERRSKLQNFGGLNSNIILKNKKNIFVDEGASVEARCVLDARQGPVFIDAGATVMAGSILRGPVAICKDSTVKMQAQIYGGTTIGPVCKAGGEINNTIFHSYSNKAHDGYIGSSVVGQWCNFGAGTQVSNLKNNYSTIPIVNWKLKEFEDSNQQFAGVIMGDHTKTAVNTSINSGTVCGVNCNLLTRFFPPKFIHSFSWVSSNVIQPYKLEKALETMEIVMSRRNISMKEAYKDMMKHIFEQSRLHHHN